MTKHEKELSFIEVVGFFKKILTDLKKKWVILLAGALFGALCYTTYSFFKPKKFVAKYTFILEESNGGGGLGQYAGIASAVGINVSGDGGSLFQGENLMQLYKSKLILRKVLSTPLMFEGKRNLIINIYNKINFPKENIPVIDSNKLSSDTTRLTNSIFNRAIGQMSGQDMKVEKLDEKLSIIQVSISSTNELLAQNLAKQLVSEVNNFYIQTKTKKSLNNYLILKHQTDSVKRLLDGSIFEVASINDATPNINPTRLILKAPAQRSQVNAQANQAVYSQLLQSLELSKISLRQDAPLIQTIDAPNLPLELQILTPFRAFLLGLLGGGLLTGIILLFYILLQRANQYT